MQKNSLEVTHWGGLYSAVFDRIWQWGCEDFWFVGASGEWRLLFWEARTCWKKHLGGQTPWDGIPMFAMAFATCNSRLGVQKMMTRLTSCFVDEFDRSQTFRIERTSGWTSWEFLGFSGWKNVSELFRSVSWVLDDMISCDFYLMMLFGSWWQHSTVWWVWWLEVSTLESTLVVYDLRTCWAQQIMVKSHLDPFVLVRYHPTEGFAGRKEKARVNQLELKVLSLWHMMYICNCMYVYKFSRIQIDYI